MDQMTKTGRIIFLNGTSSSGKTTIAKALQKVMSKAYLYVSVDNYLHQLPDAFLEDKDWISQALPSLLAGFNNSSAAMAHAGNNVIIDQVLQESSWMEPCVQAFEGLDVVFIGVRCPLDVLEAREKARGDRQAGMALYQYDRVHSHGTYDVEVDSSKLSVDECVSVIRKYVQSDQRPTAFEKLRAMTRDCEQGTAADADKPRR